MKATEAKLLDFLKKSPQFVIPIYQRTYSWTEKECRQLWDDVARCGRNDRIPVQVWDSPKLDQSVLLAYRPKGGIPSTYTLADHPHLLTAAVQPLFEAFRKEVLALDPCVSEEFLKLYVAYKAETNFVDVVPQTKRLRLSLNLSFAEISDPKGLCKDVTSLGRWGNGDVEVMLSSLAELPYVIGLVRQSLEKQLGEATTP